MVDGVHDTNCTAEEIYQTIEYALYIGQKNYNPAKGVDVYGRNETTLTKEFFDYFNNTEPAGASFRLNTYDCLWIVASALNCTQTKLTESGNGF